MLKPKPDSYYQGIREDVIELVPKDAERVLDIGCAFGITGENLKKRGVKEVIGVELDKDAYREAQKRLDKVFLGDIQTLSLPFKEDHFDCIIYADILEHLVNPWSVLKDHRQFLRKSGSIVASLPNVRHYRVVKKLLKGRWDYDEKGVMDSTHLRFFTLESIKKMFAEAGYGIDKVVYKISASKTKKLLNKILRGRLNEILSEQFLVRAAKL
ncbi:MAG: class I SAM-dependent methyltransferase [Candidatus Omnitrophica bacterium]|nr:class I SAM-dependent methyltransferase [Candidatus Omnitrophota bacterium]